MTMKQVSVFLENKQGRLQQVLKSLAEENISVISMYLADTAEYGMLRLMVDNPDKALEVLKEKDFSVSIVQVIATSVPHAAGSLYKLLDLLVQAGVNVDYMYAFANTDDAAFVFKTKQIDVAIETIVNAGYPLITE